MCGRFFVDAKNREIDRLIESLSPDADPFRSGEVFPTSNALVLNMQDNFPVPRIMKWGFPRFDGKGVIFNARSESAMQKSMFRDALLHTPALVPCNGFYEWKDTDGKKEKYLFSNGKSLLYLAGFWKDFINPDGDRQAHFTILTTAANESVKPFHHRMPVLVEENEKLGWLSGANRKDILSRTPTSLIARLA